MAKVISSPPQYRAEYGANLQPGDIVVMGEGETQCEVVSVDGYSPVEYYVKVTFKVLGLNPEQHITRSYRAEGKTPDLVTVIA